MKTSDVIKCEDCNKDTPSDKLLSINGAKDVCPACYNKYVACLKCGSSIFKTHVDSNGICQDCK